MTSLTDTDGHALAASLLRSAPPRPALLPAAPCAQIPREATGGDAPALGWPTAGGMACKDLRVRYRQDLAEIIHGTATSTSF